MEQRGILRPSMNQLLCLRIIFFCCLGMCKEGLLFDGFVRNNLFQWKEVTDDRPPWKDYPELCSLANLQWLLARVQEFPY